MDKTFVFLLLIVISGVAADVHQLKTQSSHIHRAISRTKALDWCPQCINSFDDLIDVVLDIILQFGIMDSCGHLCDLVTEKTGSGILGFICTMGCDFLGLEEFSKMIQAADVDPIYYCETINLCPINDNGDAKFTSFTILPPRAQMGTTIALDLVFASKNGTGTGEMILTVQTVDKIPLAAGFLVEAQKPGTYSERITIDTTVDPDCDPTRSKCELWLEGIYNVTVMLCNGQCGSHHPHTAVYDTTRGSFSLYEE